MMPGLPPPAERRDPDGVDDQHQRNDQHQRHHARARPQFMPFISPKRLSRMLFWSWTDCTPARPAKAVATTLYFFGSLQLDAERLLHLVRRERCWPAASRRTAPGSACTPGPPTRRWTFSTTFIFFEVGSDLLLLLAGDRALGAVGRGLRVVLVAEEDRDVDLVVPVVLHRADLLAHQQRRRRTGRARGRRRR